MAVADVLKVFRDLKREGTIEDFVLYGSVAAMVYTRPFYTKDVDIGIVGDLDAAQFARVFSRVAEFGPVDHHSVIIGGTPTDVFPVDVSPIIQDGAAHAIRKRVEGVVVKVVPAEHLLIEALRVNRPRDRARVLILDEFASPRKLRALFRRLDSNGALVARYRRLAGKAP